MNRSLRRQRQPKERPGGRAPARAIPRSGPREAAPTRRHGLARFVPRLVLDVWSELKKVVWPTREETMYLTVVVVVVTLILGAVLGAIDIGFGWLIERTLLS